MNGEDEIQCIGVCQDDEFGYCIGCGRKSAETAVPQPSPALPTDDTGPASSTALPEAPPQ